MSKGKDVNTLVIAVTTGKGGKEFKREAEAFCDHWNRQGYTVHFAQIKHASQTRMRRQVTAAIAATDKTLHRVVFFCHGTWRSLRCGWNVHNVHELAALLLPHLDNHVDIGLYACSCGRRRFENPWKTKGYEWIAGFAKPKAGFAAMLCQALWLLDIDASVFAHGSVGHTTRNPYAYYFDVECNHFLRRTPAVKRGGPGWKIWRRMLKTDKRFEVFVG